jgi:hypothetical protein
MKQVLLRGGKAVIEEVLAPRSTTRTAVGAYAGSVVLCQPRDGIGVCGRNEPSQRCRTVPL